MMSETGAAGAAQDNPMAARHTPAVGGDADVAAIEEALRDVIDTYYAYLNDFPNGTYTKQAQKIFDRMNSKKVSE